MIPLSVSIFAFLATYLAGRKSLGRGIIAVLVFGYFYGILRANLLSTASYFIFDSSLVGLYLSQLGQRSDPARAKQTAMVRFWTIVLVVWPILMIFLPFQPLLVSLVGLRGSAFFIPVLLFGARLKEKDLFEIACGLAVLNVVVFVFAAGEYFFGIMRFYPYNAATLIIYASGDVAGNFFRIPATFANAHGYGGAMADSLPLLMGLLNHTRSRYGRLLAIAGMGTAMIGVLMSAARLHFIVTTVMVLSALLTTRSVKGSRWMVLVLVGGALWLGLNNERLGRFKSLSDTDYVGDRIAGSVNRGFWEILTEYPIGNGLGGGGTSIPYFLQGQVRNPIGMENSYSLILCEQGIIGLLLWVGFVGWFLSRAKVAFAKGPWSNSRRMAWCLCAFSFATAWIGTGILTAIPGTVFLVLSMGWTTVPQIVDRPQGEKLPRRTQRARTTYAPIYS